MQMYRVIPGILVLLFVVSVSHAATIANIRIPYTGGWPKTERAVSKSIEHVTYIYCERTKLWDRGESKVLPLVNHRLAHGNIQISIIFNGEDQPRVVQIVLSGLCRAYLINKDRFDEMLCIVCGQEAYSFACSGSRDYITCTTATEVTPEELQQREGIIL